MENIDTLLIAYGMDPTLLGRSDKIRLDGWLAEAKAKAYQGFSQYAEQVSADCHAIGGELSQQTERLGQLLSRAKAIMETRLGKSPSQTVLFGEAVDNRALTAGHLKMLEQTETLKDHASALSSALAEPSPHENLFSHAMEVSVRHIALCEGGAHESLCRRYAVLGEQLPSVCDEADRVHSELITACNAFYDLLSYLAKATSDTVTSINRSLSSHTDYFNLMRSLLLQLHTLSETTVHLQKEADRMVRCS